jgi:hypothetical protein
MRSNVTILLVFLAGLLLGAFVSHSLSSGNSASERLQLSGPSTVINQARPDARTSAGDVAAKAAVTKPAQVPPEDANGGDEAAVNSSSQSRRSNRIDTDARADNPGYASTPKRLFSSGENSKSASSESSTSDDRAKLHSAYRVSCQFDPGYSALIGGGAISTGGANWQGGQIIYDVVDAEAGRATMNGSAGATGSNTGSVEVQMLKSNASLSFSGVVPRGDLIVTTIFTERNSRGSFLAVMSTHAAANGLVAAQFYGACDVL